MPWCPCMHRWHIVTPKTDAADCKHAVLRRLIVSFKTLHDLMCRCDILLAIHYKASSCTQNCGLRVLVQLL